MNQDEILELYAGLFKAATNGTLVRTEIPSDDETPTLEEKERGCNLE